ncbi:5-oxoprolinase subunit PxpB [Moraxella nasovis]|uniref:5-oxoprolinase subunit PxpB n=1 Tax=Moraxella nasovis TaxID=2904121 RepID=UPI001F616F0B|nr:5-oxoprolinase subunit PxpB [Moraxella nasovis]UNU73656.1 5-oxoprolinase subunit PxpB [Moraxella nasovis]
MDIHTHWQVSSERTLSLFLGDKISLHQQKICWALSSYLATPACPFALADIVVGMNTLTLYLKTDDASIHTLMADFATKKAQLDKITHDFIVNFDDTDIITGKHIKIPVVYGGEHGVDLADSAKRLGMSVDELVACHTSPIYTVYFIGFIAGFPYLGGLPKELYLPRHAKPRTHVPAGSVGIGGAQTGIYPFSSPGGWQLLGRTDMALFDKTQNPPTLLNAGDTLQFVAVDILK